MTIRLHRGDLPDLSRYTGAVAIDTETMGLSLGRDRLCLVQLSPGDGSADVVQIPPHGADAPNLKRLLTDAHLLKIFHFARFDLAMLCNAFGVMPAPVYCTKIASRLARTYTDKHGLKDLVRELLGVEELGENSFYGSSYFVNPRGQIVGDAASDSEDEVIVRDLDMSVLSDVRRTWAFYRDRRPDSYGELVTP